MPLLDELRARREEILALAAKHGITDVRVFGSVARGEEGPGSDVDLLIAIDPTRSLIDLSRFRLDAGELLARKCDAISQRGLHPLLREHIMAEAKPL